MGKLFSWIIALTFLVLAVGCGGGKPKDIPININPPPRQSQTPPKKEPTPEEKWLSETCTRCHETTELKGLQEKVALMTAEELEEKFRTKMIKGDLKLSDEEIAKVMQLFNAMKEAEAKKAGETPPPAETDPAAAPG